MPVIRVVIPAVPHPVNDHVMLKPKELVSSSQRALVAYLSSVLIQQSTVFAEARSASCLTNGRRQISAVQQRVLTRHNITCCYITTSSGVYAGAWVLGHPMAAGMVY